MAMLVLMAMLVSVLVAMPVLVLVARTGTWVVRVRVAHHPRMTEESCCSTSTTTPRTHLQPGRTRGDRRVCGTGLVAACGQGAEEVGD